jgi:hypothetical protein
MIPYKFPMSRSSTCLVSSRKSLRGAWKKIGWYSTVRLSRRALPVEQSAERLVLGEYFILIHPEKSAYLAKGEERGSRLRPQVFVELLAIDIEGAADHRH